MRFILSHALGAATAGTIALGGFIGAAAAADVPMPEYYPQPPAADYNPPPPPADYGYRQVPPPQRYYPPQPYYQGPGRKPTIRDRRRRNTIRHPASCHRRPSMASRPIVVPGPYYYRGAYAPRYYARPYPYARYGYHWRRYGRHW